MSERQKVLFLAHRIPYPPNKGDKIRSWRMLEALAERYDVSLATFIDDPDDWRYTEKLKSICSETCFAPLQKQTARLRGILSLLKGGALSTAYFYDPVIEQFVKDEARKPLSAVVAFSSAMVQYIDHVEAPAIVDFCDADSAKWVSYAEMGGLAAPIYRLEAERLQRLERSAAFHADVSFAVTPREAALIGSEVRWFGNGVDTDFFHRSMQRSDQSLKSDVIFTGRMDYPPNVEAVYWLADRVWPLVMRNMPEARFAIVGAKPTAEVRALVSKPGVLVTGAVDDIRPWLANAKVAAAPLAIARGVQNKVLEAMAMGLPVIASTGAAEGLGLKDGDIGPVIRRTESADCEAEWASAIVRLLESSERRQELGSRARAVAVDQYSWSDQLAPFLDAVARIARPVPTVNARVS
ncbi:MAG: TIGR03087 family PEP-CTERM/XrtA system glycosyltransferase [Pseudomonadota bacterium]